MLILGSLNISSLISATQSLQSAIAMMENCNVQEHDLLRDGCIQRFEYTFELSWKTIKKILAYRGIVASSPREVLRLAAKENLIDDPIQWFIFLEKRNLTAHVYDNDVAEDVYHVIPDFLITMNQLLASIKLL